MITSGFIQEVDVSPFLLSVWVNELSVSPNFLGCNQADGVLAVAITLTSILVIYKVVWVNSANGLLLISFHRTALSVLMFRSIFSMFPGISLSSLTSHLRQLMTNTSGKILSPDLNCNLKHLTRYFYYWRASRQNYRQIVPIGQTQNMEYCHKQIRRLRQINRQKKSINLKKGDGSIHVTKFGEQQYHFSN